MAIAIADRNSIWRKRLQHFNRLVGEKRGGLVVEGKLTRMVGLTLEAAGCQAAIGGQCEVINSNGDTIDAEVVGFSGESLYLMLPVIFAAWNRVPGWCPPEVSVKRWWGITCLAG